MKNLIKTVALLAGVSLFAAPAFADFGGLSTKSISDKAKDEGNKAKEDGKKNVKKTADDAKKDAKDNVDAQKKDLKKQGDDMKKDAKAQGDSMKKDAKGKAGETADKATKNITEGGDGKSADPKPADAK